MVAEWASSPPQGVHLTLVSPSLHKGANLENDPSAIVTRFLNTSKTTAEDGWQRACLVFTKPCLLSLTHTQSCSMFVKIRAYLSQLSEYCPVRVCALTLASLYLA